MHRGCSSEGGFQTEGAPSEVALVIPQRVVFRQRVLGGFGDPSEGGLDRGAPSEVVLRLRVLPHRWFLRQGAPSEGGFKTEGAPSEDGFKTEGTPSEDGFKTDGDPQRVVSDRGYYLRVWF